MLEDAVAVIGASITVADHLLSALAFALPDDFASYDLREALDRLREAHERAQQVLGV